MNNSRLKNHRFITGSIILLLMLLVAVISIFWTPDGINKVHSGDRLLAPSFGHLFGTDNLGRDVFSRVMVGIRTTLLVAVGIVGIGAFFGTLIGALTGYFGGLVDEIIMRLNDGLASFPSILLAMVCVAVFGTGTGTVIIALGILFIPSFARVVRSEFLREKEKDYVKNIRLHGAGDLWIMFRHILPNIRESLLSAVAIGINNAILAESGLSYLGLGVQPPTPSLGRMMSEGQTYVWSAAWICIFPGIMIMLIVMAAALVSDGMSNALRSEFSVFTTKKMKAFFSESPEAIKNRAMDESGNQSIEKGKTENTDKQEKAEEILSVENLHVVVDPVNTEEVVHGVSFSLKCGEALGIVGESGSGKSLSVLSVLNLINGKGIYTADSIKFCGRELLGLSEEKLCEIRGSEISLVFQEPMTSLDPGKKIGKLICEAIEVHADKRAEKAAVRSGMDGFCTADVSKEKSGHREEAENSQKAKAETGADGENNQKTKEDNDTACERDSQKNHKGNESAAVRKLEKKQEIYDRAVQALRKVGIEETERIMNSYPHELSGGQRQRVLIAMALINSPRLIILDEPTTALDADVAEKIIDFIDGLHDRKELSVIFISHDIGITKKFCDRILVMKDGLCVEEGSTEKITTAPENAYTVELLEAGRPKDYKGIRAQKRQDAVKAENSRTKDLKSPEKNVQYPTTDNIKSPESKAGNTGAGDNETITENRPNNETSGSMAEKNESTIKTVTRNQSENENIIEVENLSVSYLGRKGVEKKVINNLNFKVRKGECFGISGESGSGKTTILKALCKHIPYEGKIIKRGTYSMVFQDPYSSLNPSMKVISLLVEALSLTEKWMIKRGMIKPRENESRKERKQRYRLKALKILEDVELTAEYADRYPHELSGGQRQRVAIAMAIIGNPDIIFLDEPVTALDVTIQRRIMTLLNRLMVKKNLTYIMISHDAKLLNSMCDEVLRL